MYGGEREKGGGGLEEVLVVFGEATVASEPRECAFDDPSPWLDLEALRIVGATHDLEGEDRDAGQGGCDLASVVGSVGPDQVEPGEAAADAVQHERRSVSVLDAGGMDDKPERQALGVDQNMSLAALYSLAGVVTHRVDFTPPFSADLTDWLSRIAAVGLASRPSRSRKAM